MRLRSALLCSGSRLRRSRSARTRRRAFLRVWSTSSCCVRTSSIKRSSLAAAGNGRDVVGGLPLLGPGCSSVWMKRSALPLVWVDRVASGAAPRAGRGRPPRRPASDRPTRCHPRRARSARPTGRTTAGRAAERPPPSRRACRAALRAQLSRRQSSIATWTYSLPTPRVRCRRSPVVRWPTPAIRPSFLMSSLAGARLTHWDRPVPHRRAEASTAHGAGENLSTQDSSKPRVR